MYEIYKLTSPSGKNYIGMTKHNHLLRFSNHLSEAKMDRSTTSKIHRALRKYPDPNQWQKEVVCTASTEQEACEKEKHYIKHFDSIHTGYNLSEGGNVGVTGKRSEETRKKISEAKKGCTPWNKGKTGLQSHAQTDLQKQKAKEANSCRYRITYLDGTVKEIVGIKDWVKENLNVPHVTFEWQRRHKKLDKYNIASIERVLE